LKKQKDFKTTLRGVFMSKAKLSYEERIAAIKEYREGKGSYNEIAKKVWDSSRYATKYVQSWKMH
jgi:transposase-like protein